MPNYGMTPQGFVPKRLAEIQFDINSDLSDIVDPRTGQFPFQNPSDDTVLQQIVGVFSEALSECWNAAYSGAIQFDPLKNFGAGQSGTVQLNAMLRRPGTAAIIELQLSGIHNTFVPRGSLVSTTDNRHVYATLTDVVIADTGVVLVQAQETVMTDFNPEPGTVVRIVTVVTGGGWRGVTNTATIAEGVAEETDEELRMRQQRSTSLTSYRLIEAIYAAILNVPGVIYCRAYQNPKTYPVDDRGIPFKEVAVVAEGGLDYDVARAIFLRLPTGQVGYGTSTVVLYDNQGHPSPISFSRPLDVLVYVRVEIVITERSEYPDTGADEITQHILDYARYGGDGKEDGFPPGDDILVSRLYTPVNEVGGFRVSRLEVRSDKTGATDWTNVSIPIAWNEVGRFDATRISVTIVDG